jgi:acyl-CoA synthetase (AMP-forming)/AMP-acid ligase II
MSCKTRGTGWHDASGKRFIPTGDVGRFDADGSLLLFDRRKDMVASGGFNVYHSDLEGVLREHTAVAETAAVVGVPSEQRGETPPAHVACKPGSATSEAELLAWFNQRVGKTQRLASLHLIDELTRSAIGKVLKRELRERHVAGAASRTACIGPPDGFSSACSIAVVEDAGWRLPVWRRNRHTEHPHSP